ncbi:protein FAM177A1-like isoform X2 [Belonocnema kinseyi]|uniref:protein FAM177A1-like isoform X2 n=1 Tax=Belonocnema kinseyi TaxID=2817044 RepID=UPI00143DF568|nr:protein FAM177A1-like isoform X2 [Belonocnema kinseyi]
MLKSNTETCDLHNVILQEYNKQKKPKRILTFSDGVLEEYSEDETDAGTEKEEVIAVNPKKLPWLPWAWYHTTWASGKVLEGCDSMGEYLAEFFGITTPKYQFEIDEYYRIKAAEEDMLRKEDLEMGGWTESNKNNLISKNES